MSSKVKSQVGDVAVGMKRCTKCGEEKRLSEFRKQSHRKDGLTCWCKACLQEYSKKHRSKPNIIKSRKEYNAEYETRPEVRAKRAARRSTPEHKEYMRKYHKSYMERPGAKDQQGARSKEYRARPEVRAHNKEYKKDYDSRPEVKERKKQQYLERLKDPEVRKRKKEYYADYYARPEIVEARSKRSREHNAQPEVKERTKEYRKEYMTRSAVKSAVRLRSQRRRALTQGATIEDIDEPAIYDFCDNCCVYCKAAERLTIDHIIALAVGGPHCQDNLLVACKSCNSKKHTKDVDEWLKTRPESNRRNYAAYKKRKAEVELDD